MNKIKQTSQNVKQTVPKLWELTLTASQAGLAVIGFLVQGKLAVPSKVFAVVIGTQAVLTALKKFLK